MAEIIDLSDSPPSSPRSSHNAPTILNVDFVSVSNNQIEEVPMSLMASTIPKMYQPQPLTNDSSQLIATSQHTMQMVATGLEPLPQSNSFLFPNGTLEDPWTHRDHELLEMGLTKYGRGRWSKISRHFLRNKTPQEVQSYAGGFSRHLPSTYQHSFRRSRKPAYSSASLMYKNNNLVVAASASASSSIPMVANEPQQSHMLLSEKCPFLLPPSCGNGSSSNNNTIFQTSGASSSINATAHEQVDLELRLGRSQ